MMKDEVGLEPTISSKFAAMGHEAVIEVTTLTHVEDAELLQDAGVGVVVVLGVVSLRKPNGLDVDERNEGETEDPVGHVADHVVEVGKHVQRSGASGKFDKKTKCIISQKVWL